jgi:hypothetical protein
MAVLSSFAGDVWAENHDADNSADRVKQNGSFVFGAADFVSCLVMMQLARSSRAMLNAYHRNGDDEPNQDLRFSGKIRRQLRIQRRAGELGYCAGGARDDDARADKKLSHRSEVKHVLPRDEL